MAKIKVGTVNGQLARNIHNYGDNNFLFRRSYKDLLHDELAGACHEDLDHVRTVISDIDLYRAVKRRALQTDESGQLARKHKWFDLGYASLMLAFLMTLLTGALWLAFQLPQSGGTLAQKLFLWSLVIGVVLWGFWVMSRHVWPQRTAKRAMQVLENRRAAGVVGG